MNFFHCYVISFESIQIENFSIRMKFEWNENRPNIFLSFLPTEKLPYPSNPSFFVVLFLLIFWVSAPLDQFISAMVGPSLYTCICTVLGVYNIIENESYSNRTIFKSSSTFAVCLASRVLFLVCYLSQRNSHPHQSTIIGGWCLLGWCLPFILSSSLWKLIGKASLGCKPLKTNSLAHMSYGLPVNNLQKKNKIVYGGCTADNWKDRGVHENDESLFAEFFCVERTMTLTYKKCVLAACKTFTRRETCGHVRERRWRAGFLPTFPRECWYLLLCLLSLFESTSLQRILYLSATFPLFCYTKILFAPDFIAKS